MADALEVFEIGDISLSPATFDVEKLDWLNGVYLRQMPDAELAEVIAKAEGHHADLAFTAGVIHDCDAALSPRFQDK